MDTAGYWRRLPKGQRFTLQQVAERVRRAPGSRHTQPEHARAYVEACARAGAFVVINADDEGRKCFFEFVDLSPSALDGMRSRDEDLPTDQESVRGMVYGLLDALADAQMQVENLRHPPVPDALFEADLRVAP